MTFQLPVSQLPVSRTVVVPLDAEIDLTNRDDVYDRLYAAFVSGAVIVVADFTGPGSATAVRCTA